MWQAQERRFERERCRKEQGSCELFLGHAVKSRMTVIFSGEQRMGRYQKLYRTVQL